MIPTFDNGVVRLLQGDVRAVLRELPTESVQTCVTSPPYWGLRDYGLPPLVWGGDEGCEHAWREHLQPAAEGTRTLDGNSALRAGHQGNTSATMKPKLSAFCTCGAWRGSLGLEPTIDLYVQHIVEVFREVRRVLRSDGTLWLNMGDSYASNWPSPNRRNIIGNTESAGKRATRPPHMSGDLKEKDLCGMPWRVAFALQADGWWLRSDIIEKVKLYCPCGCGFELEEYVRPAQDRDIIWSKPNPMPESVIDRPTRAHEYLFLLTKSARYYYDVDAIREEPKTQGLPSAESLRGNGWHDHTQDKALGQHFDGGSTTKKGVPLAGRNKRSVWEIATEAMGWEMCERDGTIYDASQYRRLPRLEVFYCDLDDDGEVKDKTYIICLSCKRWEHWASHFATFPQALVEPCVLAGTPAKGSCSECGAPWERRVERARSFESGSGRAGNMPVGKNGVSLQGGGETLDIRRGPVVHTKTTGWASTCHHDAEPSPSLVLDPFVGSGTTAFVAQRLGRRAVGIDLSTDYLALAEKRLRGQTLPMKLSNA